ncbi:threonyl-tRNA synthetase [Kitasatospora paracochleata]|uniref:Threonyl-tRNA synthetase n=1 Tax=Kitasatospora paracochleata TaxID=58354 RepID=A0ABT1IUQ2_9ACTN|nr:threonyl-tRNA synthetase [Kitasatospora paracochleata]
MSTIQVDFQLPQRFELEFQGQDGNRQRPVMIHRALFGSIERFFAVLLEHYAGAMPPWLAPVTVVGIPITDEHVPYLREVAAELKKHGIRVDVDASDDRMQKKIRNAQKAKIPFMLIAGNDDVEAGAVSFRYRNGEAEERRAGGRGRRGDRGRGGASHSGLTTVRSGAGSAESAPLRFERWRLRIC